MESTINPTDITESDQDFLGGGLNEIVRKAIWKSNFPVAIKTITITTNVLNDKQLRQEIDSLKKLDHENVIKYHGHVVSNENTVKLVTELATNGSVEDRLKDMRENGSRIPSPTLRRWSLQAAKGLQHIHKAGIVHRGIKPSNLVLTSDDTLKICDFSISESLTSTSTVSAKGTARYQAPETMENIHKLSPKSDVFSYGVTLCEMFSGEIPYKHMTDLMTFIFYVCYWGLRPDIPKHCPSGYSNLMQRCWDGSMDKRPDMSEIVSTLESPDETFKFGKL